MLLVTDSGLEKTGIQYILESGRSADLCDTKIWCKVGVLASRLLGDGVGYWN